MNPNPEDGAAAIVEGVSGAPGEGPLRPIDGTWIWPARPGEGVEDAVREAYTRNDWTKIDALVARAEVAEARVEELLVKWSEAKYAAEAAEAKVTALEEHIDAGTLATQAVRIAALEAELRKALDAAMEAAKQDLRLRAEHAEMAAAIARFVAAFDERFKPTGIEEEYEALRAARIQGEAP